MKKSRLYRFWGDYVAADLRDRVEERGDEKLFDKSGVDPDSLDRALELAVDASQAEQNRETNLNARGAAVASVAGIVVSVSTAVSRPVFDEPEWTDWTKFFAVGLFLWGLFAVAMAMVIAVFAVLRPGRGARTKNFLGQTLAELWMTGHAHKFLRADKDRLNLLRLDRFMNTLPAWHFRNRDKARWLRRSWMFLASGIVLVALAAVFVLAQVLGATASGPNGPAEKMSWGIICGMILGAAVIAWLAVRRDWLWARRQEEKAGDTQISKIAESLGAPTRAEPQPADHGSRSSSDTGSTASG